MHNRYNIVTRVQIGSRKWESIVYKITAVEALIGAEELGIYERGITKIRASNARDLEMSLKCRACDAYPWTESETLVAFLPRK